MCTQQTLRARMQVRGKQLILVVKDRVMGLHFEVLELESLLSRLGILSMVTTNQLNKQSTLLIIEQV